MITLTVDDNPNVLQSVRDGLLLLDPSGTHRIAASGDEALDLVSRFPPDVIFLDVEMPGLNGLEVATETCMLARTVGGLVKVAFECAVQDVPYKSGFPGTRDACHNGHDIERKTHIDAAQVVGPCSAYFDETVGDSSPAFPHREGTVTLAR